MSRGHTYGRGILIMNVEPPDAPNEFWRQTLEDFQSMEIVRTREEFEDADEAMEEPVWDGKMITPPASMSKKHLWEDEMGVRKVHNLVDRNTRKEHQNHEWLRWIRGDPQGEARFGGKAKIIADHKRIKESTKEAVRKAGTEPGYTWQKGEIVAYFTRRGEAKLGRIILPTRLNVLKGI